MDFRKLIDDRHSIRTFEARPVDREKVARILHAASRAPSAGNLQSYKIALVTSKERIGNLRRRSRSRHGLRPRRLSWCFSAIRSRRRGDRRRRAEPLHGAGCHDCLRLRAVGCADEGVGACRLGVGTVCREVREALGLRETFRPMSLLAMGYPGGPPLMITTRRPTEEMVIEFDD